MTYEEVKKIRENPTAENVDNQDLSEMIDIAIEKQIPKICKMFKDVCDCGYSVFPHMAYCSKCGKKLVWGGNDGI